MTNPIVTRPTHRQSSFSPSLTNVIPYGGIRGNKLREIPRHGLPQANEAEPFITSQSARRNKRRQQGRPEKGALGKEARGTNSLSDLRFL